MKYRNFTNSLSHWSAGIATIIILIGCLIMVVEVISRDIFDVSFIWAEETTRYLTISGVFLLVGPLFREGMHVKVAFLYEAFSKKTKRLLDLFHCLLSLLVCTYCIVASKDLLTLLYKIGAKSISGTIFHPWTWQLPLITGFSIASLIIMADLINTIVKNDSLGNKKAG